MDEQGATSTWQQATRVARDSYGRLVALLSYRTGDIASAEDALSSALLAALEHWPRRGVPTAPEAWLLTVARRELQQQWRHRQVTDSPAIRAVLEQSVPDLSSPTLPDERLRLMLACARPELPAAVHGPLMLQVVLGLDAHQIPCAYLVSPTAMAQRLVRAKQRIRAAGLRYEDADAGQAAARLQSVLDALYGAFAIGSSHATPDPIDRHGGSGAEFSDEVCCLTRLVAEAMPDPEALGLLALMRYSAARRPARFDAQGRFVALEAQDRARWDWSLVAEAEQCLARALQAGRHGAYQLEAAIQSAHCQRAQGGATPWQAIDELYAALVALAPTIGARVAQAVARAEAGDPGAGLRLLHSLPRDEVRNYQPYWVARAWLGHASAAGEALERAIGLTIDGRVRAYLAGGRAG